MKKTIRLTVVLAVLFGNLSAQNSDVSLKNLVKTSIQNSQRIKIDEARKSQYQQDKKTAFDSYLPKLTFESTYTLLNDDIRLSDDFNTLLMGSQALLIKEQAGIPFNQPLTPEIMAALAQQGVTLKDIPPIQEKNILKANVSGEMILFSGLKIPYSVKATNELIKMTDNISEQEKSAIIKEVIGLYDKMGVIAVSEDVLATSEKYLNEQEKFVNQAVSNGLTTDLDKQRIELAKEQLDVKRIELNSSKKLVASRLAQLSGLSEEDILKLQPRLQKISIPDFLNNVNDRSDIKALDNAISAADYNRKIQYTDYIPKVFAFGKKELITTDLSAFDPKWYVGVGLRWNFFDGFTAHHNAQKAKLERIILEDRKDEAVQLLNLGMEKSKYTIEKDVETENVAEREVSLSEKSYNLSLKEYQNGLITMKTHLESINDLEKAKLDQIQALYELRSSVIDLYDISGKLNENTISLLNLEN